MLVQFTRAVAAIAAVAANGQMCACTLCMLANDSFSVPHPHAVRIALATRSALENGTLRKPSRDAEAEFETSLVRLTHLLTYPFTSKENVALDVLVVDDSALYRVEINGLRSRVTRISAGNHTPTPIRVVTTVPVVHSIGRLEVRIAATIENGLLEVETSGPADNLDAARKRNSTAESSATPTR